jgi:hypothetical protein
MNSVRIRNNVNKTERTGLWTENKFYGTRNISEPASDYIATSSERITEPRPSSPSLQRKILAQQVASRQLTRPLQTTTHCAAIILEASAQHPNAIATAGMAGCKLLPADHPQDEYVRSL